MLLNLGATMVPSIRNNQGEAIKLSLDLFPQTYKEMKVQIKNNKTRSLIFVRSCRVTFGKINEL
jgi:hypothetical protein